MGIEAVVVQAFMTSTDAVPARQRVSPSADPDDPMVVDIPGWAFTRHFKLGNCLSLKAYQARRVLEKETERQRGELKSLEKELGRRALADAALLALDEELAALEEMDKRALLDTARQHKLGVPGRGSEEVIRGRVRAKLQHKLDELTAVPVEVDEDLEVDDEGEEPHKGDGEPDAARYGTLADDSVRVALPKIAACEDAEQIGEWARAEKYGDEPRKTVMEALGRRYRELDPDALQAGPD